MVVVCTFTSEAKDRENESIRMVRRCDHMCKHSLDCALEDVAKDTHMVSS